MIPKLIYSDDDCDPDSQETELNDKDEGLTYQQF